MPVFEPDGPPNVALRAYVPSGPPDKPWHWVPLNDGYPVAHEWCYGCNELANTMRVTLLALARIHHRNPEAWRLSVVASGRTTGWIIARDTWRWDPFYGKHLPEGAPMCVADLTAKQRGWSHVWNRTPQPSLLGRTRTVPTRLG